MKNKFERFLSNWPIPDLHMIYQFRSCYEVSRYNDPNQPQAAIRVVLPGIKKDSDDFCFIVVNKELGGGMNSRLLVCANTSRLDLSRQEQPEIFAVRKAYYNFYSSGVNNTVKTVRND